MLPARPMIFAISTIMAVGASITIAISLQQIRACLDAPMFHEYVRLFVRSQRSQTAVTTVLSRLGRLGLPTAADGLLEIYILGFLRAPPFSVKDA
jgi:hypothetical protein